MKRVFVGFLIGLMGMLVGCEGESGVVAPVGVTATAVVMEGVEEATGEPAVEPERPTAVPTEEVAEEAVEEALGEVDYAAVGYSYVRPDGNRLVAGMGGMPEAGFVDVDLGEMPLWVVGSETAEGEVIWAVALRDGRVVFVDGGEVVETVVGQPPALAGGVLLTAEGGSPRSHPVMLPDGRVVAILENGDVGVFGVDGLMERVAVDALVDGRMMVDESGRLLVLTTPSDRYGHGVLGDAIEPTGVAILETSPELQVVGSFEVPAPRVMEAVMPIWADVTGDGVREIIVTLADAENGGQLVAYDEAGNQVVASEPIGQGNRWRNQLAVGAFGPNGELELADVRTPHLSGTVEFFQVEGDRLVRVGAVSGYTSHVIGSPNLDMGIAGDFDGSGRPEVMMPTLDRTVLAGIERIEAEPGAAEVWRVELPGRLTTNVAAVGRTDGRIMVAVGTDRGILRVWER